MRTTLTKAHGYKLPVSDATHESAANAMQAGDILVTEHVSPVSRAAFAREYNTRVMLRDKAPTNVLTWAVV